MSHVPWDVTKALPGAGRMERLRRLRQSSRAGTPASAGVPPSRVGRPPHAGGDRFATPLSMRDSAGVAVVWQSERACPEDDRPPRSRASALSQSERDLTPDGGR